MKKSKERFGRVPFTAPKRIEAALGIRHVESKSRFVVEATAEKLERERQAQALKELESL